MHEEVNKRKNYKPFKYENLEIYKNSNLINAFNKFVRTYNTNGNLQLIAENHYRKQLITGIRRWIMQNISHFII